VTRADVRAELSLPLLVAGAATIEPYLRGAALGYLYDAALDPEARAWAVGGAIVSTEISRRFGALRHTVVPSLEWRLGSAVAGPQASVPAYDAWDRLRIEPAGSLVAPPDPPVPFPPRRVLRAAPEGTFQQLRLAVGTRLSSPTQDLLRLVVGQDLDLSEGRPGETWFSALASVRPFALDVRARIDAFEEREEPAGVPAAISSWLDGFTSLRATASVADRRGDRIALGLVALGPGASGDLVAGVDALFDPQPAPVEAIAQGTLATSLVLGPATLGWEAQFPGRPLDVPSCPGDGGGDRRIGAVHAQQHVFRFAWDSPCRCFRVRASVTVDDCGRVGFSGGLDLGGSAAGAAMSR
jgi:LPS-assembly protein